MIPHTLRPLCVDPGRPGAPTARTPTGTLGSGPPRDGSRAPRARTYAQLCPGAPTRRGRWCSRPAPAWHRPRRSSSAARRSRSRWWRPACRSPPGTGSPRGSCPARPPSRGSILRAAGRPPGPSTASPGEGRAPAAPPSPLRALGCLEGDAAGEQRAEPGLRAHRGSASPGRGAGGRPLRPRALPRRLAGAAVAVGAALRAVQTGGRHGARGRVDEGPQEVSAEAAGAAATALRPTHAASGARGAPYSVPPSSPLLKGAIASGPRSAPTRGCRRVPSGARRKNLRSPRAGPETSGLSTPAPVCQGSRSQPCRGQVQTASGS